MKIKAKKNNKTDAPKMQKTIQVSEVQTYLLANPGNPLYVVHSENIIFRLVYFKGSRLEMTNYAADEDKSITKHSLEMIQDPSFWTEGDIIYTVVGIKEMLDREGVKD